MPAKSPSFTQSAGFNSAGGILSERARARERANSIGMLWGDLAQFVILLIVRTFYIAVNLAWAAILYGKLFPRKSALLNTMGLITA